MKCVAVASYHIALDLAKESNVCYRLVVFTIIKFLPMLEPYLNMLEECDVLLVFLILSNTRSCATHFISGISIYI